ncbi:DUF5591 domain-containing protein, partial [Candidatus Hodarchaeum mangrovi]
MVYEIIQSEGWGRFGFIPSINDFFTPNIVNTILSSDWDNETSQLKLGGYKNELNIPLCYIYPSLQMQGKILEDIKSYEDLFPEELKNRSGALEFHVIPWDLPNIYLDNFPEYIDTINQFDADFKNDEIKLVLNFPFSPEILNLNLPKLKSTAISTISLGDISSFLTNPDLLIKLIKFIKTWVSPDTLLYAPGIPLSYLPILTYLGIDLFDLFQIGMISANKNQIPDLIIEYDVSNRSFIEMIKRIRLAIKTNKLRDLVRIYANSYPPNKALLIKIDKNINLEENTPIFGSNTLYCTDETDFFRPEVVRFRNRVKERYFPSNYVKGVIFLPCSARKPYS